ncbi:disintegrin and metalloproteinase domain-containing protein 9-like [Pituophis catenifer annectens]|uniref:disintegrin and metalloproteinase domain-containing protein 9-like n=1 Tax=Pituophis catenifer annectens TaxID=94852 RepID=UPI003991764D
MSGAWLLLLWVLFRLGSMEDPSYLYSEVTVPTLLEQPIGAFSKKEISYLIKIEGVHRILRLYQRSFVIQNMPIYSLDLKGVKTVQHPKPRVDCYYSGYVEDLASSDVVISTCNGLWGHIQIGNLMYAIQPIENFTGFRHLLYRQAPESHTPCRGTVGEVMGPRVPPMVNTPEAKDAILHFPGKNVSSRYLEYFAVCDHSVFQWANQNVTQLMLMVLQIVSVVHNVYNDIGLHVVLTGMEVWAGKDHLPIGKSFGETTQAFHSYANSELQGQTHFDHAALFTNVAQDDVFARTWKLPECLQNQISVSVVRISPSVTDVGVSAAHQLGHAFGFVHDDLPRNDGRPCECNSTSQAGRCLMHSTIAERYRLSNCSKEAYFTFLQNQGQNCFLNLPKDVVTEKKTCGNGLVEDGEQCDCGMEEACVASGCCRDDCQLIPGANCLQGPCCQDCKLLKEGTVCREAVSDCDLDEYCLGTSESCPPDVFKQNGMPCGIDSTCYSGACLDIHRHCQTFFGKAAKPAPLSCYKEVNLQGDRTGNCGTDKSGYKKCPEKDVSCGRLQCTNVHKVPRIPLGFSILQTPIDDVLCWSVISHQQGHGKDDGTAKDGTSCGPSKVCINRSCVDKTVLNYDCDFSKCNNQGVCNSKKNCHCSYGWAPPHCSGRGFGGSIDSGPAPERVKSRKTLMLGSIIGVALLLLALTAMLKKFLPVWIRYGGFLRQKVSPEPMDSAFESTGSVAESIEESTEGSAGKDPTPNRI